MMIHPAKMEEIAEQRRKDDEDRAEYRRKADKSWQEQADKNRADAEAERDRMARKINVLSIAISAGVSFLVVIVALVAVLVSYSQLKH